MTPFCPEPAQINPPSGSFQLPKYLQAKLRYNERPCCLLEEACIGHVFAEFYRVTSKNLKKDFYEALDHHTTHLIDLFKSRKGVVGQSLGHLFQPINSQTNDITTTRTVVLQCLPLYLGDNSSEFFLSCSDSDTADDFTQVPVGVLNVMTSDMPPLINSVAIILEGNLVMDDIPTTSQSLCLLFGLIYALHLDYPKVMKNTFEFIQKILLNIGQQKLSPKLQTLKKCSFGLDVVARESYAGVSTSVVCE
ncbi:uncharacterized protein LOC111562941 [Amphiprion ocellaris]|uniref:uncharacterized protein LOC111562941 n=1 Tax=Amphiprion ocellaris TaxID=80972 RepID=UPI0024116F66|nr:uncharacterized protein LOC111562941 [Amphiprion ocellaris]